MDALSISPPYASLVEFILEHASPDDILAFTLPESQQQRIAELLDKQDEETLTPEEAIELQQIVLIDRMLLALKARALKSVS